MKNKLLWRQISRRCLTALTGVVLLGLTGACSDANEPEVKDVQVNGFKEQDPAGYAAYTASLRAYKATTHQIAGAILYNAPEISVSERDFLRSLPDSLDFVAMRNSDRLSQFDRADMTLVRRDFNTRILYFIDAASAQSDPWQTAAESVMSGQFDGVYIAASTPPDPDFMRFFPTDAMVIFAGNPSLVSEDSRDDIDYFVIDISNATEAFDVELAVRTAALYTDHTKLILATAPGSKLTDIAGIRRNSLAGAATAARDYTPQLAGIAIDNISADYYDPDIIYRHTRGAIQILNPANKSAMP